MIRSINSVASRARRKRILKRASGYRGRRKNVYTVAKNAVERALAYNYRDRRKKKGEIRKLWILRINAGVRMHDCSYSSFMSLLRKKGIILNRKVLAFLAYKEPDVFSTLVEQVKK